MEGGREERGKRETEGVAHNTHSTMTVMGLEALKGQLL